MLNRVSNKIESNKSYLLAVSGGIDSMVLLDVFKQLKSELNIKIHVAHVNHGVRITAERDQSLVEEVSRRHQINFYSQKLGRCVNENFEAWARGQRYEFFHNVMQEHSIDFLVTAHTASDSAETLLMRLISNKEPRGILAVDSRRKLIRPFLEFTRAEICEYAKIHKIEFNEDETNQDNSYLRNRVRNKLIPVLEKEFSENIQAQLSERAKALAEDQWLLDEIANTLSAEVRLLEFGSKTWLRALQSLLRSQPEAIRWRIVRELLDVKLGFILGRKNASLLSEFFISKTVAIQLPGAWEFRRHEGGMLLTKLN